MNILVTSSYYWPELTGNAPYVSGMAEHYARIGHRVVVSTTFPHYPDWKPLTTRRLALTECHNRVEIRRRWHYVPGSQSAIRRALYEGIIFSTGLTALPSRFRPDAIVGISPVSSCAHALIAGRLFRRPFGLVFHDLIGQAAAQAGIRGGAMVAGAVAKAELELAQHACRVAVYSEGMRNYFVSRGIDDGAIRRVRPWTLRWQPTEPASETRRRLGWSSSDFICLHAGNMGFKQGLENLLAAAARLTDPSVRVVLTGEGNQRQTLERRARESRLRSVSFVDRQPWGRYEAMLRAADVLIVNQRASVGDMAFPSKLTSYFPAGRPVIGAVRSDSDAADELRASGSGIVVEPEDPDALVGAIAALRADPRRARQLGQAGNFYANRELMPDRALSEYDAFLADIVAPR